MRRTDPFIAFLALAVSLEAQDVDPECCLHLCDYTQTINDNWKLSNPSGPSDWWNSYKAGDCNGETIKAIIAGFGETAGIPGSHAELGIYPDLGGGVPDSNAIVRILNPLVHAGELAENLAGYSIPTTTLGSAGYHVAAKYVNGDSHTWMSADNNTNMGRTFFTATGYSTGAVPYGIEIALHLGASLPAGTLLVNGGASASVTQTDEICLLFVGPAVNTQFALYLCVGGIPGPRLLPLSITVTDGAFAGPCPQSWEFCTTLDCSTPTGSGLELCTVYLDPLDGRLKFGSSINLDITPSGVCDCTCFGQKDDCFLDGNIWKVQNPAGPSDWFNVNHGTPNSCVTTLTSVSIASWDFCGFGPCWANVGIYGSNMTLDSTGQTPDLSAPLTVVSGTSACMPAGAAEGDCATGLTIYDTPDIPAPTSNIHAVAQWANGDSCIWLGSDTDGIDSLCGTPIPSDGSHSLFTLDNYTTAAVPFSGANWMMQINWN